MNEAKWVKVDELATLFGVSYETAFQLALRLYFSGIAEISNTSHGKNRTAFSDGFAGADGIEFWLALNEQRKSGAAVSA